MAAILTNLHRTMMTGFLLALVLFVIMAVIHSAGYSFGFNKSFWSLVVRWLHVLSGIMWIGHLYYFNFTQIPNVPKIPEEHRGPAISKVIAPAALFWFRWAALATLVTGLILAALNQYIIEALLLGYFQAGKTLYIGIGMWLGLIMAFNVWNIIWPNQQKVLGLVPADDDEKKAAARIAMLTSRFNTMFSIPMLYFMVAAQNL